MDFFYNFTFLSITKTTLLIKKYEDLNKIVLKVQKKCIWQLKLLLFPKTDFFIKSLNYSMVKL